MAAVPDEPSSPVLANLVVLVGFVAVFCTFLVDSPVPWILGGLLIVAGGIWAGVAGPRERPDDGGAG